MEGVRMAPSSQFIHALTSTDHFKPSGHQAFVWRELVDFEFLLGRRPNVVYLDRISARRPGKGSGSTALTEVVRVADRSQAILWLEVKPLPSDGITLDEAALVRFYDKFGFKTAEFGFRTELGGFIDMIRVPGSCI
jgi:hypothetical protein